MNKNLWLLTSSQVFGFSASPVTVFLSGIIGSQISPLKSLSTLPTSSSIIGTAIFTIFAAKIMSFIGRKFGFILASIGSSISCLLAAYSIYNQFFILYCVSCFFIGTGLSFVHQYRFAASESVDKNQAPKAISIILLASIISAFIGPNLANLTKLSFSQHMYVGSYLSLAVITFFPAIFLSFYKDLKKEQNIFQKTKTRFLELISRPRFFQAMVASAFAYAVMAFLMTATPLSMHVMEKISLTKTGLVIQLHVASMYLPSLLTGYLIKRFGHSNVMYLGVFFFALTVVTSLFDQNFINYLIALVFLGLGWNFLFISGTSLLVLTYKEEEKFKAQGSNDLIVFSSQALASLSAGILLSITSWKIMNLLCIPFLILIIISTIRADILSKKID